jgi:hypothetical protein
MLFLRHGTGAAFSEVIGARATRACAVSKNSPMKRILPLIATSIALTAVSQAVLVAGFDFQTTATGGTAAVASATSPAVVSSPLIYTANFGTATLYLDGTHGASSFTTGVTNPQVTAFGGSTVNTAGTSFSTTTTGAASLAIANQTANGFRMVFGLSMTDLEDLSITYATQKTATGFSTQTWSYSTDGTSFTTFDTKTWTAGTATIFADVGVVTLDTSTLSSLDGLGTIYIGVAFSGATAAAGNNRLDNIQFNAIAAVPEPRVALLGAFGVLGLLRRRR